jgi:hypothetical protein
VLVLVLGLREGEALGLTEPDDGSTDTLPLPPICITALRIARRNQD